MEPDYCKFVSNDFIFWGFTLLLLNGWVRFAITAKTGKWPQLPFNQDRVKLYKVGGSLAFIFCSILLFMVVHAKYFGACELP
ncbi:hypothetical protein [Vibrio navarrensis]|uniref:Uncharacterized protein n=1 Tax=Vibrio navarrensis TaxID=29495 RepID=A0AAJ4IB77_9VIBR|nr:hypothetical protein I3X05_00420 [Vibrio navarrensis]